MFIGQVLWYKWENGGNGSPVTALCYFRLLGLDLLADVSTHYLVIFRDCGVLHISISITV